MITTIIIFIIVLGVLVFVHEFGHFFAARKSGMKVEEFGFGFPPRIFGLQKKDGKWRFVKGHKAPADSEETVYSVNWIPFGGFVRIMGENNENEEDSRSFVNRPFLGRFVTLVAGVTMNWLLAAVLFSIAFAVGVTAEIDPDRDMYRGAAVTNRQVAISYVAPGLPAAEAGLMPGDFIEQIDGRNFGSYEEVQSYIRENKGKAFEFRVKRINEMRDITVQSVAEPKEGEGPTGIALTNIGTVRLPWHSAVVTGFERAVHMTAAIFMGIYDLFTTSEGLEQVGGPVKIAQLTGQVADLGFVPLMNFAGLLSINLAILNILPFPALDGGRIVFLVVEKIRGKRNNQKVEQWVNAAGFFALIFLMLFVTARDISGLGGLGRIFGRLFGG